MAPPRQGLLIARRVGVVALGLFAHKSYLARHGTPKNLSELVQHDLIGFDEETPFLRAARKTIPQWSRAAFSVRTDSGVGQVEAIARDKGVKPGQVALAWRKTDLVRVLALNFEFKLDTWVTMHEDLRGSPRCRVTFDALVQGLTAYVS